MKTTPGTYKTGLNVKVKWSGWLSLGLSLGLLLAVLLQPTPARAHESRELLGGKYQLRVGFAVEPVYQGLENGLFLAVCTGPCTTNRDTGLGFSNGVTGAFDTLKAEVIFQGQTMALNLTPVAREPGRYNARLVPTRAGDYTFHVFGNIENDKIDERFTSSPTTFDSVQPLTVLQFPDKPGFNPAPAAQSAAAPAPAPATTAAATVAPAPVAAVSPAELQTLREQLRTQQQETEQAKANAATANLTAIIGLVLAALGLGAAAVALLRNRGGAPRREIEGG